MICKNLINILAIFFLKQIYFLNALLTDLNHFLFLGKHLSLHSNIKVKLNLIL